MRLKLIKRSEFIREEIHFLTGRDGKIIGHASSGKIALISRDYKGIWVRDGDDWLCDIMREEEKMVIVMPVERIKSSEQNKSEIDQRLEKLKSDGFRKENFKPKGSILFYKS
jgi:hypothetical protein